MKTLNCRQNSYKVKLKNLLFAHIINPICLVIRMKFLYVVFVWLLIWTGIKYCEAKNNLENHESNMWTFIAGHENASLNWWGPYPFHTQLNLQEDLSCWIWLLQTLMPMARKKSCIKDRINNQIISLKLSLLKANEIKQEIALISNQEFHEVIWRYY